MGKCFNYQNGTDTAGNPTYSRHCECGTTVCTQTTVLNFKLTPECDHYWYKCEPETDDIEHCRNCGTHRRPHTI